MSSSFIASLLLRMRGKRDPVLRFPGILLLLDARGFRSLLTLVGGIASLQDGVDIATHVDICCIRT